MEYHFSSRLTATLNLCLIYFKITWALAILSEHMHKKFEINWTKIGESCWSGRKAVTHDSKSDLPLVWYLLTYTYVSSKYWCLLYIRSVNVWTVRGQCNTNFASFVQKILHLFCQSLQTFQGHDLYWWKRHQSLETSLTFLLSCKSREIKNSNNFPQTYIQNKKKLVTTTIGLIRWKCFFNKVLFSEKRLDH